MDMNSPGTDQNLEKIVLEGIIGRAACTILPESFLSAEMPTG
jgi:hypothetical protein